jgi:hypothetical protein
MGVRVVSQTPIICVVNIVFERSGRVFSCLFFTYVTSLTGL